MEADVSLVEPGFTRLNGSHTNCLSSGGREPAVSPGLQCRHQTYAYELCHVPNTPPRLVGEDVPVAPIWTAVFARS